MWTVCGRTIYCILKFLTIAIIEFPFWIVILFGWYCIWSSFFRYPLVWISLKEPFLVKWHLAKSQVAKKLYVAQLEICSHLFSHHLIFTLFSKLWWKINFTLKNSISIGERKMIKSSICWKVIKYLKSSLHGKSIYPSIEYLILLWFNFQPWIC